jgi:hypothetical protein
VQPRLADDGLRWMSEIVPQELQARKSAIAQIRVVAHAERRKQVGREKILEILVTLPDCKWAAECENYPGGCASSKADGLGDVQFACETAKFCRESVEFPS